MSEELLERARSDRALQEALRTSVEMAALAWEDEAGEAEDLARDARARWAGRRETDAGDEAAAALFTATTHFADLLVAQLANGSAPEELAQALQAFADHPPGEAQVSEAHGPRAAELYAQHVAVLCWRARGAMGG